MREERRERREGKCREAERLTRRARRPASRLSPLFAIAAITAIAVIALSGCGTTAKRDSPPPQRGGGYYLDDGPGASPPADLERIPDAVPRVEPLHRGASRPYTVMGRSYTPMTSLAPYRARGVATWYGRRYHGKQTSSGENYDMYAMTAAHTTLPIPSYARVTNPANGRSVVVRINDRGPFLGERLIDLSYVAAHRLGVVTAGSAVVDVESIIPGRPAPAAAQLTPPPPAAPAIDHPEPAVAALAPESAPTAHEIPAASVAASAGIYLQFGAFGSKENAEIQVGRLQSQASWLSRMLHVYAKDGLYRVHAGPYANQTEARQAADRLDEALGIKSLIVVR